jgi:glycosyltransferase involved in cell wall biosynthesis
MKQLTAIILNHNNGSTLISVLNKLTFVKKILIIDDFSTLHSLTLNTNLPVTIIRHALHADFSAQRNFALEKSATDWVLFLDSDEILSDELIAAIQQLPENPTVSAFYFHRSDYFWRQKMQYGETASATVPRLVNKNRGRFIRPVHEVWQSDFPTTTLKGEIKHYPHPTLAEFLTDINFYSTINAKYYYSLGKKTNLGQIVFFPLGKFIYTYCLKLGFLDGPAGFVYSFMMSFHSFLTWGKLYLLTQPSKK